ncbi:MAG: Rpn family recombination-promoting nuclease/putative transposase, partial [Planctomycetota bacterium]
MTHRPRSALFRAVMTRPEVAVGELRAVLPRALVTALDLSTLRLREGTFVDPAQAERRTDCLYSVDLADREVLLYVLFEHQSTVDPLMALRVLIYMGRIWDQWLREHGDQRRIPVILPVVVYQGPGGWTAATDALDLYDLPPDLLEAVIALRAQRRRPGSSLHVPWHDLTGVEPVQSSRHAAPEWLRPT